AGPGGAVRITPACAGNTRSLGNPETSETDHPRVRGEHANLARIIHGGVGSPPRARGTPAPFPGTLPRRGITPASPGSTGTRRASTPRRPDHPRVRGEHRCSHGPVSHVPGSPPRARGTHDEIPSGRGCWGITPACAGNTLPDQQV